MRNFSLLSIVIAFFLLAGTSNAQNTCISDASHTADASAVLDVYSTTRGMLVPSLASNPSVSNPANGLLYFNTTSNSFKYNSGSTASPSWTELSYGSLWTTNGTDTYLSNPGENIFIGGTTNPLGYKFYVQQLGPGLISNSRIDGQLEIWNYTDNVGTGDLMLADINDNGGANGIMQLYSGGTARIRLLANGNSYFNGGAVCIGGIAPTSLLHIVDNNGFGSPQILLDNISGIANTAVGYKFGAATNYSQGIEPITTNFVLANTPTIGTPVQGDGASMISAFPSGIIDFNNQSRARVYLDFNEPIPTSTWHPIDYTIKNYDQQNEWTPGAGSPNGGPPMSFFTATEEGYYQVNARTEYFLGDEMDNWWVNYDAYVSIAIYKGNIQGNWTMYAQGNNLQIGQIWNPQGPMENGLSFKNNNAPNVSDVVYLQKGERIAIYTWQSSGIILNLVPGTAKTYCSVHKSS
ncbi:MAG: hypothetical protein K8R86_11270 [Bacteroidales bacterium]|nr:hypothetical protein [Bacteroidales bacterium]